MYSLKEIEKLGAKAGVVEKTVKEIVEILMSEHKIECEKVGSGNYYWSFPSKAFIGIKTRSEALVAQAEAEKKTVANLEAKLASMMAADSKTNTAERAEKLKELASLKAEKEALDKQLKLHADSDPDALREMMAKAKKAKECADRWTDNVWALKSHLTGKYGKSPGECDALIGIPDDFDYVK